jgi:arabinan endo-1,5-alpha-L-arabinosidase
MTGRRTSRGRWSLLGALALALMLLGLAPSAAVANNQGGTGVYSNPLKPQIPSGGIVESCADPSVIRGQQQGDNYWYMYCTTDPLNDADRDANGNFVFHRIPMFKSLDLVNWTYEGDASSAFPTWAATTAALWAPEISYFNNQYYLYYVVTDVKDEISGEPNCGDDNAIGVATSASPLGPWVPSSAPVIAPRRGGGGCNFFWTFDPDVLIDGAQKYIYYGSYYGGIFVRPLDQSGLVAGEPATQITIANRYEGAEVIKKGGFYYLFVSATNCCNGPLTAYSVFAGRSTTPTGPFIDREGVSLLAGRVGGTPVISMNGNRWVGTGHNTVFRDFDGQWWTIYHAVDRNDPYFEGAVGFTKRPALLDAIDWVGGWPAVRGGQWASNTPQHAPAAQPGDKTNYKTKLVKEDVPGHLIAELSDEFSGAALREGWEWVRQPAAGAFGLENGTFRFNTQVADLFVDSNNASVLTEPAPNGNYVVETRFQLNLPPEGCCYNYVQAGLVIYGDDDNFIKLVHVSIWETRQTEFAKELSPVPAGYPRYGNTVVGPPSEWTYLRIVKRTHAGSEEYTAYTSQDGQHWVRGGTWTHNLGTDARIGLVSMGGSGFVANFDYVRVYKVKVGN